PAPSTLSLHDALPISARHGAVGFLAPLAILRRWQMRSSTRGLPDEYSQHPQGGTQYFSREPKCAGRLLAKPGLAARRRQASSRRSEEHTSELQSRSDL